jgi:hypothetical protein
MKHLVLFIFILAAWPLPSYAAWIEPSSLSVTVAGTAESPSGEDSFSETEVLENAFGTRSVSGDAASCWEPFPGFLECSRSSASAVATVTANSISFSSHVTYGADSRAQYNFQVVEDVPIRLGLSMDGYSSSFWASIFDSEDNIVMSLYATNTVTSGPPPIGDVRWKGDVFSLDDFLEQDWRLTPGSYSLTVSPYIERLAGSSSPGDFDLRLVPEPSAICLLWLPAFVLLGLRRHFGLSTWRDEQPRSVASSDRVFETSNAPLEEAKHTAQPVP